MTVLHKRRFGSLLSAWAAAFLLAGAVYWLQATLPALVDILTPLYLVLAVVMIVVTWKWFRWRGRDSDRRHRDRRHLDRRHMPPESPSSDHQAHQP